MSGRKLCPSPPPPCPLWPTSTPPTCARNVPPSVLLEIPTNPMTPGKTLSLHAGAHSTCASEPLHSEAPGHRGELPDDGEHPARTTSSAVSTGTSPAQAAAWLVCSPPVLCCSAFFFPARFHRDTDGYVQMWRRKETSTLRMAPRPPLELWRNPTQPRPLQQLRWHNCTTTGWLQTGTLIWFVSLRSVSGSFSFLFGDLLVRWY